jgi:hypothetical protein
MCYEEFIREKKIGKIKVEFDVSKHKSIKIVDNQYEEEIHLSLEEFKIIVNFIEKTEKELEEVEK